MAFRESMGTSSAVASVLHSGGNRHNTEVTKAGSYIYAGEASDLHEWEFKTTLRLKAAGGDDNKHAEQVSKVVDGLRGDVIVTTKELGLERLWQAGDQDLNIEPGVDV